MRPVFPCACSIQRWPWEEEQFIFTLPPPIRITPLDQTQVGPSSPVPYLQQWPKPDAPENPHAGQEGHSPPQIQDAEADCLWTKAPFFPKEAGRLSTIIYMKELLPLLPHSLLLVKSQFGLTLPSPPFFYFLNSNPFTLAWDTILL